MTPENSSSPSISWNSTKVDGLEASWAWARGAATRRAAGIKRERIFIEMGGGES